MSHDPAWRERRQADDPGWLWPVLLGVPLGCLGAYLLIRYAPGVVVWLAWPVLRWLVG